MIDNVAKDYPDTRPDQQSQIGLEPSSTVNGSIFERFPPHFHIPPKIFISNTIGKLPTILIFRLHVTQHRRREDKS